MKILNVSTLIPLKGLIRNNDIVLKLQEELKFNYNYEFRILRSIPYTNSLLKYIKLKWRYYHTYKIKESDSINRFSIFYYSWISFPSSSFIANYLLLPFNYLYFKFTLWNKLRSQIKDVDLLISQNLFPDSIIAYWLSIKSGKPYTIHLRGKFPKELKNYMFKLPVINKVFLQAQKVTTPSPVIKSNFQKYIDIEFIPHPVDNIFFSEGAKSYETIKFISVSRLLDWKNIDMVLNELSILKKDDIKFRYEIVGDGPELEKLRKLTKDLNLEKEVNFLGYLEKSEVRNRLINASVFILPSYFEIFGISYLEAAAAKCLVVCHQNSGVHGLLKHNESGIFVNKDNIQIELHNICKKLNSIDYLRIINEGNKIAQELTWSKITSMYHNTYINSVNRNWTI